MSRHLGPRAACAARGCSHACAAFVAENTDGSPKYSDFESPELLCFICEHTWLAHKPGPAISSQHQLFVRGGTVAGPCAGFFSYCLQWFYCPSSTYLFSAPHVSCTATSAAPVPHRPAIAFANLPRPLPAVVPPPRATTIAIVQQERRASIQRNLHPNEPSSSTTTPPGRKRQRMSGPPRSYADPVPTLSLLDDFASPTVAAPTTVKIMVGILPKVLDTSEDNDTLDLSSRYQWKSGGEIEKVQKRLQLANLVFEVDVSTTGPIFEEIDVAWANHCLLNRIDYATSSAAVTDTPNTKAWVLTGPKGRGATCTWVDDPKLLTRFTFTLPAIRALPFSYTPNNLGEGIFLFVAPRFRNLHGPISSLFNPSDRLPDQILAHRCFGRCVLHPILTSLADDPDPVCGPSCTNLVVPTPRRRLSDASIFTDSSDDDVQFPDPNSLSSQIVHASPSDALLDTVGSSSTSTLITRSMRHQQWQEAATATALPISTTALFIPGPLLVSAMKLAATSIKSRSFLGASAPMDLTLNNMPGAGSYSFASWQDYILLPRASATSAWWNSVMLSSNLKENKILRTMHAIEHAVPSFPHIHRGLLFATGCADPFVVPVPLDHGIPTYRTMDDLRAYTWISPRLVNFPRYPIFMCPFDTIGSTTIFHALGWKEELTGGRALLIFMTSIHEVGPTNHVLCVEPLTPRSVHGDVLLTFAEVWAHKQEGDGPRCEGCIRSAHALSFHGYSTQRLDDEIRRTPDLGTRFPLSESRPPPTNNAAHEIHHIYTASTVNDDAPWTPGTLQLLPFYHYNIDSICQLLSGPLGRASPANEDLLYAFTPCLHTIARASAPYNNDIEITNLTIAPPKLFRRPAAHRPRASLAPQRTGCVRLDQGLNPTFRRNRGTKVLHLAFRSLSTASDTIFRERERHLGAFWAIKSHKSAPHP
ncbi:hypothetical protein B0H11DRAFT_2206816 [Mycena galericulata]|nr:hypothetical protein B0H11DRAFT_2206816 [Mycena galericulata]